MKKIPSTRNMNPKFGSNMMAPGDNQPNLYGSVLRTSSGLKGMSGGQNPMYNSRKISSKMMSNQQAPTNRRNRNQFNLYMESWFAGKVTGR